MDKKKETKKTRKSSMEDMRAFSNRLQAAMDFFNLHQVDVANITGYRQATISRWLSCEVGCHPSMQEMIIHSLGKPIEKNPAIPPKYKIKIAGREVDLRKVAQIYGLKPSWSTKRHSTIRLAMETVFLEDSEKIFAWFEE